MSELTTTIVAGTMSLIGTFGSILLTHHLNKSQRRSPVTNVEPSPIYRQSGGASLLVPIATLVFAFADAAISNYQVWGFPYEKLVLLVPVVAIILLWWRARSGGAGYRVFLFDMLILSAGWVAGYRYAIPSMESDTVIGGVAFFVAAAFVGGLVFLMTGRSRVAGLST